ncbi:hypothetical protein N9Y81_00270 [Akkermansiaceae bacterium]|jgi:hypothetical protein|nr:hypothetical protein [Akkermansiaceae bacterium]
MIKLLRSGFLVGFVSLVSSCGTGAEQANSKSPFPVQGGTKQRVTSAAARDYSDTLITNDGDVYKSVKIKEITPAGIKITHSSGMCGIPYENLSKKLQNELGGFNPIEAKKHRKKINSQQAKIADVFEARRIQDDKLERDREAEIKRFYEAKLERYRKAKLERERYDQLVTAKNRRLGRNKARTQSSSTESTNSLIARLAAQQRVKMIEQERLQEQLRRAGDALKVDNADLDRRLKQMELDQQLREQEERARQLHDALKMQ